jgi:uncharacterized protein
MIGAGIEAGADDITAQLALPEVEAQKRAAEADEASEGPGTFWPLMFVLGFLFVFIWVFMRVVRATSGRWTTASDGVRVWSPSFSSGGSSSSGWSSSSSSFSGGGGSFGGGGASGSW